MSKRMGRRLGQNNDLENSDDVDSGSDQDVLLRLKDMAQEILNLQTAIAVRQKEDQPTDQSDSAASLSGRRQAGQSQGSGNAGSNGTSPASTKEGRLIRRSSAKLQESQQPAGNIEQKLQQLSELRYELSNELEVSLKNLQKVMQKSQDIVSEMNELLKQQGSSGK